MGAVHGSIKVLFLHYQFGSFIRNDYEILARHFDVKKLQWKGKKSITALSRAVGEVDVAFTWFANDHAAIMTLLSRLHGKPSVVIVGGGDVAYHPEVGYGGFVNPYKRQFTKYAIKNADIVLPVTHLTEKEMLRWAKPKKCMVIYNGIDTGYFTPGAEKEDLAVTSCSEISAGTIMRKGIKAFVGATRFLPQVKFVITGKLTEPAEKLFGTPIPDNLEFTGYVSLDELRSYYRRAKVYCQASFHEGFGVALVEAMACGCVPVITKRAALPEVCGSTGIYVPYGNAEAIAEAIRHGFSESGKRLVASRKRAMEFDLSERERHLVGIIEELVQH